MTTNARDSRDRDSWARPVEKLTTTATGAPVDTVTGRRVSGPMQGFGQLWQKTFRVPIEGVEVSPEELVATWKASFASFWPKQGQFYGPLAGIAPGEVALLDVIPLPGAPVRLSSGILVVYADDESFTFMTPEGHMLSAWITFSAFREGDVTIAQAQALERTSDPFDELAYMFGVSRMNNSFWSQTLENLARHVGVAEPAVMAQVVCVDRRRQWRHARNIRYSATLRTARHTLTAPIRWITRRG